MNPIKTRVSIFAAALLAGLSVLGAPSAAYASSTYPPLLQVALEGQLGVKLCVPQCSACHLTNEGGPGMLNAFGSNLETVGHLSVRQSQAQVTQAVQLYFMTSPNGDSDHDNTSDADEIKQGDSPAIAGDRGQDLFCPDIKYGCAGGRIAAAPARNDRPALFASALVAICLGAAMRRRARRPHRAR
jgi:hypothetical protein